MGSLTAALILAAASLVGAGVAAAPPANALTPPVGMTADDLSTWQTNGIVWAMAEAEGVVFAGGTFSTVRPPGSAPGSGERSAVNFAAFHAATGAPTNCELSFTTGDGSATVRALAVSPDRKTLYAGGSFGAVNGVGVSNVAAIDIATCSPKSFPVAVNATVRALAVTDDTVYLGGDFSTVEGQDRVRFGAVTTAGALKPWTADADEPGRAIEVTPNGQNVVLGGDFFRVNGADSHALAVVNATSGSVVKNYPLGFIERNSVVKDITSDETGIYTANEGSGGGVFDGRIALNLSDFNQRWRDTCLGATQGLAVYKSVLYSASHAHDCGSMDEFPNQPRKHLLAESVNDPKLLGWFPDTDDGLGEQVGPRVLQTSSVGGNDYMWVGGGFTRATGNRLQQGLTRYASDPDTGAPAVPQVNVTSTKPGEIQVRWQSSLDLDDSNLTYRVYRDGAATPVRTVSGDSLPWSRPQLTYTDTDVAAGSTHSYRVTASDGTNTSARSLTQTATVAGSPEAYPNRVQADGASLYWRFDEASGSFATDASGTNNNGVNRNGPLLGATPPAVPGGSAITYNGSNQYTNSDRKTTRPAAYSLETWFKTTTGSGGKLIGFGDRFLENSGTVDKHIYMTNDGRLIFGVNSGWNRTISTGRGWNDGQWHHIVATQGNNGIRLYVDGSLRASDFTVTSGRNYTGYWRVGGDTIGSWPSRPSSNYFAGQIDETAVYPSVLSPSQISQHYSLGSD
ncbi:LamG-like jellyroll fold domain-containing protein [Streptomyces sp. H27-D2]|uniref:LamG-like jellyroll fold domain-containing protein n=1 Tax=Streptomyces sp. H27-D2 TaxID=3046304 RepID=UPI002DB8E24D|nr:LamG-like jellyroll fold domain-containing protein [Streptomyces sp. H27-D2]MEC4017834.1 LamG-like jellyroll fold domain-containing protein [Streptomyces sp. H27-D2]